jgi:integrase
MTPDFAQLLLLTPETQRRGRVFRPQIVQGIANQIVAQEAIALIGRLAGIKVYTDSKSGKVTFASSRSLRKSFGCRWAVKVTTPVLQKLMRHADIQTTMNYYVDLDTDSLAEGLWARESENCEKGYVPGYFPQNDTPTETDLNSYNLRD